MAGAVHELPDAFEDNFRYVDTYHDFIGSRGFSATSKFDEWGRSQIYRLMNTDVRKPPIRAADAPRDYSFDGLGQISKTRVEHDTIAYFETSPATRGLFHRLAEDNNPNREKTKFIIRLSDLTRDDYYQNMHDMMYEIEEDIDVEKLDAGRLDKIYTNLKMWLGWRDARADGSVDEPAIMCDGPPQGVIRELLDKGKCKYAYTWISQYDSAGVIGTDKKREGSIKPIDVPDQGLLLTRVMQLSKTPGNEIVGRGTLESSRPRGFEEGDFRIHINGGLFAGTPPYLATQNRGLSVSELTLLIRLARGLGPANMLTLAGINDTFKAFINAEKAGLNEMFSGRDAADAKTKFVNSLHTQLKKNVMTNPMFNLFIGKTGEQIIRMALDIKASGDSGQVEFYKANRDKIGLAYTNDLLCSLHFRSRQLNVMCSNQSQTSNRAFKIYKGRPAQTPLQAKLAEASDYIKLVTPIISFACQIIKNKDTFNAVFKKAYDMLSRNTYTANNPYLKSLIMEKIVDTVKHVKMLTDHVTERSAGLAVHEKLLQGSMEFRNINEYINQQNILEQLTAFCRALKDAYDSIYRRFDELVKNCGFTRYLDGQFEFANIDFIGGNFINFNDFFKYDVDIIEACEIIRLLNDEPFAIKRSTISAKIEYVNSKLAQYSASFYKTGVLYKLNQKYKLEKTVDTQYSALGHNLVEHFVGGARSKKQLSIEDMLIHICTTGEELYTRIFQEFSSFIQFVDYSTPGQPERIQHIEQLVVQQRPSQMNRRTRASRQLRNARGRFTKKMNRPRNAKGRFTRSVQYQPQNTGQIPVR